MNHTHTDYLFQAIPAGAGHVPGSTRGDDGSSFDGHLSNASTSVFDVAHSKRRTEAAPPSSPHDDRPRDVSERDSDSPDYDDKQSPADCSRANSSDTTSSDPPADSAGRADDGESDHFEEPNDGSDASESAAVAPAGQPTPTHQTKQANAKSTAEEVAGVAGDKALAKLRAKDQDQQRAGVGQAQANSAYDELTTSTATGLEAAVANGERSNTADSTNRGHNNGKRAGQAGESAKDGTSNSDRSEAGATTIAAEVVESDELALRGVSEEASGKKLSKRDTRESADDGSGRGIKSTASTSDSNDAVAPVKNSPAIAAVAANLANPADNAATASKDGTSAVKPIKGHAETSVGPLGRALRAASELARGNRSNGTEETSAVDPTRFVGRVAKAFHTAQERGGVLQLRLSPPELGALKLQLVVKDGVMSASLETENAHARRLLLDHLPALRDRLAEQNIRVERFDVDVQQEDGRGQANSRGSNQNPYQQQPEQSTPRRGTATQSQLSETTIPEPANMATHRIGATEINLIV